MIKSWKGEEQQKLDLVFGGEISTLFFWRFLLGGYHHLAYAVFANEGQFFQANLKIGVYISH